MQPNETMFDKLTSKVDSWVKKWLKNYTPRHISENKVIKDPVWGMMSLSPLEISILDSPLLQRLRRIHQTGLVNLTYPSALHTRFDHSLGMLHCATLIMESINRKEKTQGRVHVFSELDEQEVRLACLLHDIGHSTLSHLTEGLYSYYTFISDVKDELENSVQPYMKIKPKNHELLSGVIVKTPSFLSMFEEAVKSNNPNPIRIPSDTLGRISDMIMGRPVDGNPERAYISDIVNGPYDADRLDYTFRDSFFTGLALGTDAEKFISGLSIGDVPLEKGKRKSIVLNINSVSSYDHLVLSKVSLYSTVYNHQKVLATNQVVKNILNILRKNPSSFTLQGIKLKEVIDFLDLTDWDFLIGQTNSSVIKQLQEIIAKRDIPIRYVRITPLSIENNTNMLPSIPPAILKYSELDEQEKLREQICHDLGFDDSGPNTIYLGFPKNPDLRELVDAYCQNYDGAMENYNTISPMNYFSLYSQYRWAVYVFGPYKKLDEKIYNKISSIINEKLNIQLTTNSRPKTLVKRGII
ncbi:MAG: HD domain-containing protein [Treponema sp.]|nr:HD domain-containing protein [Treponema sp.]